MSGSAQRRGPVRRFVEALVDVSIRHPIVVILCSLLLVLGARQYISAKLELRSDFLDRLAEAGTELSALHDGHGLLLLPPMDRDGLREALVRPLEAVEHRFEPPALVEQMLDALEHTRAALPLL